ncbi:replicative DNA helicase [Prauserella rugosa]|uniref:Replicative DNA helicase n=1 Tax=Prauserella rugosa TaxID=43354 RepID=A0A660C458_9PSEU|nr:replicative DNA helicase [Prauserella rugosa]KMS92649.1 hypothetical protein ACZ91_03005 [Streptomyces regensis]TWH15952.1 replicative DNA helicase [Prauserella rugosa]
MSTTTSVSQDDEARELLADLRAEQSVLGGMLLSADAITEVTATLTREEFFSIRHQAVFAAIVALHQDDRPADAITVAAELDRREELHKVGGAPYLHTLIETVPTAANAGYYATLVHEKAVLRRVAELGIQANQLAINSARIDGDGGADVAQLLSSVQQRLDEVNDAATGTVRKATFARLTRDRLQHLDDLQAGRLPGGLPTGFADLDAVLSGGLRPGQLVTVAARPGVGKSTLAMDWARHVAFHHGDPAQRQPVMFFSLEMSEGELWDRVICAEARVRHSDYTSQGRLDEASRDRIYRKAAETSQPVSEGSNTCVGDLLMIDDNARVTPGQIRALARQQQRRTGLSMIVVDYLQLMHADTPADNREREVASITRELKLAAKSLEVPVVMLSQLNRKSEDRADKKPAASDLRESGAIEQDSDIIMLIHRPDSIEPDSPRAGEADLILAKNRGGPCSTISIAQQLHYCRFADLAQG